MINRQLRMTKLKAFLLVALVAAVFLALYFGPAAAQNESDTGSNSTLTAESPSTIITVEQGDVTFDYSCTGGPTGNCSVTYVGSSDGNCGADTCWVRIEYRW